MRRKWRGFRFGNGSRYDGGPHGHLASPTQLDHTMMTEERNSGSWVLLTIFSFVILLVLITFWKFISVPQVKPEDLESENEAIPPNPPSSEEGIPEPAEALAENSDPVAITSEGNNYGYRCACEGSFLPPGLMQSFSGAEAVIRMGAGQCYHKQM